jgi:hypothetical protein
MKCPHCNEGFHDDQKATPVATDCDGDWVVLAHLCPECGRVSLELAKQQYQQLRSGVGTLDYIERHYFRPWRARAVYRGSVPERPFAQVKLGFWLARVGARGSPTCCGRARPNHPTRLSPAPLRDVSLPSQDSPDLDVLIARHRTPCVAFSGPPPGAPPGPTPCPSVRLIVP